MRLPNLHTPIDKENHRNYSWRNNKLTKWLEKHKIKLIGVKDVKRYEIFEQFLVNKWIKPNDVVLEIGARLGVVSSCINILLSDRHKHVTIEPDARVHKILKMNRKLTHSKFHICKNVLGDKPIKLSLTEEGLATHISDEGVTVNNITIKDFKEKYNMPFNVIVVDCEGCLEGILNDDLIKGIEMIIYEMDNPKICNYDNINNFLISKGFIRADKITFLKEGIEEHFQQVWLR